MSVQGGKKERRDVLHAGDVEAASIEELNQKIGILEKEKNKEEEYRNYMQLERASKTNRTHQYLYCYYIPVVSHKKVKGTF